MRLNEATPLSSQATASPSMMQERERRRANVSTISGKRWVVGEAIARTAVEPHLRASLAGDDAEAVVLDPMQPLAAGRQLIGFSWKARRDEPGREATLQHAGLNKVARRQ